MISISAKKLAEIVNGKLSNIPEEFVVDQLPIINSKLATNGTFFVAFKGTQVDGHDFVSEAIKNGSAFAIVSKSVDAPSV
ncbi:MAG: UDP-N-acetylmuramyl pentapeptide synthase, partial [Actinobacteria bacterium]|nr:UDP-N-acetylmuramyl pentapeptide synthase [Actinomycetota bacterium]